MNEELYKKLQLAASVLMQTDKKKGKSNKRISKGEETPLFLPFAIFTSFSFALALLINVFFGQRELIIPFALFAIITLILLIINIIWERKQKQLSVIEYYKHKSLLNPTKNEELHAEPLSFLPKEYRNLHAILYMLCLLENHSANNLKEALYKYEAHLKDLEENYRGQKEKKIHAEQLEMMSKYNSFKSL